jgi:hypothetical protein
MSAVLPYPGTPVASVDEAVTRMEAIAAALPAADGLACFNRMYLEVTRDVGARLSQGFFAHISHDLPVAVAAACTALGIAPDAGPHYADYQKIDQLLDAAEQSVRQSFETGAELAVDRHVAAVADLIAAAAVTPPRSS